MTLVRRVARPLLAAMFVVGGLDQLKHPGRKVDTARPLVEKVGPAIGLPDDPELLVRANGAAMVGAGSLLALGQPPAPRLDGARGDARCPPRSPAHSFWQEQDPRGPSPAAHPVPQEPRPARWPAPRRRRHRGQARAGLPRAHGQRQRPPHRPPDPARGTAPGPRRRPRGQAEGGPGAACHRLTGRRPPPPGPSTHASSYRAASPSPTATSCSPPWRATSPCCGRRCAPATPCSWPGPCAPWAPMVDDVDDGDDEAVATATGWSPPTRWSPAARSTAASPATSCASCPRWRALAEAAVRFDGDPHARLRPMAPVLGALRTLGVEVDDDGRGGLPFTVQRARVRAGWGRHPRRLRVLAVRVRVAAVRGAVRRGRHRAPRGPGGSEPAAHRDDGRDAARRRRGRRRR